MTATLEQERPQRLVGLDAYRGFIMLTMASAGFAFPQVAKHFPDSPVWQTLGHQFQHLPWGGLHVLGHDPALVHVHGRRGAAVLVREPPRTGAVVVAALRACALAVARTDRAGGLPLVDREQDPADQLRLHERARSDRPGLHGRLPAGRPFAARPARRGAGDPGGLLAPLRRVSPPLARVRPQGARHPRERAGVAGVLRALGHEYEPRGRRSTAGSSICSPGPPTIRSGSTTGATRRSTSFPRSPR